MQFSLEYPATQFGRQQEAVQFAQLPVLTVQRTMDQCAALFGESEDCQCVSWVVLT